MSKQRVLQRITEIERLSKAAGCAPALGELIVFECTAMRVLLESEPASAVAMTDPASQSSVTIETLAKGLPKFTVKVYAADAAAAAQYATEIYDDLVKDYGSRAKTGSEAVTP